MNRDLFHVAAPASAARNTSHVLAAAALALLVSSPAAAEVAQSPLYLGGGNVPGNLLLVPSVEFPTVNSVANLDTAYTPADTYVGYFDPNKCYDYDFSDDEVDEHFSPVEAAVGRECDGLWSGNFMNWAATQTIDPFRKVLTGGYRVKDTPTETWLEKARHEGQGGNTYFPVRNLTSQAQISGATPFDADGIRLEVVGHGNQLHLQMEENGDGDDLVDNYYVRVRVAVCVPGMLEANCRQYAAGWKPEGLIQEYAEELRIGIFGYLNDHNMLRDGGVLRAPQKFVGPTRIVPGSGEEDNPYKEWDPVTGVFIRNPDDAYADATAAQYGITIADSGAMNYLNKFGQLTGNTHKNYDPVSELYYSALRYLKGQENIPEYTNIPGNTGVNAQMAADGFPVITDWVDPIQYACQKNVILGIGDVYTHRDKNLPGSGNGSEEPSKPASVSSDDTVDVAAATARVAQIEAITINTPFNNGGSRNNSAFIAGMAWDAHTDDIRIDLPGDQTVSTHWVDVLEAQTQERPEENQYYLAAKYGGFRVPDEFDPATFVGPLELDWWHSNEEMLDSFGNGTAGAPFPRPDNYYVAGSANQMVESLTKAFARISHELRSSASSVAANSTRLGSNTAVFQASFDSTNWSGQLQAYSIDQPTGAISAEPDWEAAVSLDALTDLQIGSRNILTIAPPTATADGSLVATSGADFIWGELAASQKDALLNDGSGGQVDEDTGMERLDYLRGSRTMELTEEDGIFRERDSRLGDIVNSDPQFVHRQDYGYVLLDQSVAFANTDVGTAYQEFRESIHDRTPMIVVGANDGMLHGFDASVTGTTGGTELFAFVPNSVFEHLYELTLPEYSHRFFVDSSPRVADAWYGSAWHTIVVGATGAGGRSVFALDVTNPSAMSQANVLWEFTHPSMGYTIGQPTVAPLPNGEFGVIVTSGYETGEDDGMVWILDPEDGSIIHSFTVPGSGDLGQPLVSDLNSDRVADRIYVGDTDGNLWRFDLVGDNLSDWGPPAGLISGSGTPEPLFVAEDADGNGQAITAPLSSAFNDKGLHTVFFGTGSFYRVGDNVVTENPDVDTFYAVIDRGVEVTRGELLPQSIIAQTTVNGLKYRGISDHDMQAGHDGWYLDLVPPTGAEGERVVARATVRGDRVIFATLIPNPDPCDFGGDSWIMELNTFTGGRLEYAVFDLNNDGLFDEDDWITVTVDGEEVKLPPSAIDPGINIIKSPAIITGVGSDGDDDDEECTTCAAPIEKHEMKVVAGSNGKMISIPERGSTGIGRQSWRQMR